MSSKNSRIYLISPHRQNLHWLYLANMLYENLVFMVIWDSHNPNKHGRVIKYWILSKDYKRNSTKCSICLISPHWQPFIGRIWLFLANMLYENLVFMVIWDSHNPNKHGRVIKYWFLSKNHERKSTKSFEGNRLIDRYFKLRYLSGTSVKNLFFANFPSTWP